MTTAKALQTEFAEIDVRSFWAGLDGDMVSFSEVRE